MNFIVDDFGKVVTAMRSDAVLIAALKSALPALSKKGYAIGMPYYIYGHRLEIANRLTEMEQDNVRKYQRYPLVALRLDVGEKNDRGVIDFNLNIALIMLTDEVWNAEERYTRVFKTVLYPMYKSFLLQLQQAGLFMWDQAQDNPKHTKTDRPYWGISDQEKNVKSIFNDPLDAIELENFQLTQNFKC